MRSSKHSSSRSMLWRFTMSSSQQMTLPQATMRWSMPIVLENYARRSPTAKERQALDFLRTSRTRGGLDPRSKEARVARGMPDRLNQPIADVFRVRHQGGSEEMVRDIQHLMRLEMLRRGTTFWHWSEQEWFDILCPTWESFSSRYGVRNSCIRTSFLDCAYLLGEVTDLRSVGIGLQITGASKTYFRATPLAS